MQSESIASDLADLLRAKELEQQHQKKQIKPETVPALDLDPILVDKR